MAHAVSSDLNSWTLLEPLISESGFDQLEVFQVLQVQQKWFVFFCSQPGDVHRPGVEKRHATYVAPAAGPLGPFDLDRARPIPTAGGYYAGRVVEFLDGSLKLFGFIDDGSLEGFQGEIGDPLPLSLSEQGELVFDVEQASAGGNRGSRLYADVSHRS
jgi:beta-fructofuranosidase